MGVKYASGRNALGICDRCAGQYMLKDLRADIFDQKPTGFMVCWDCWDEDNPQLQLGRWPVNDPQALRKPRPDTNLPQERDLWGFNPVGNPATAGFGFTGSILFPDGPGG